MQSATGAIVVYITTATRKEAHLIADKLVQERLVACVNIVAGIESVFQWEGAVQHENEVLLICKTRHSHFEKLRDRVQSLHAYDVPEIIALPVVEGADPYLRWLFENTSQVEPE